MKQNNLTFQQYQQIYQIEANLICFGVNNIFLNKSKNEIVKSL